MKGTNYVGNRHRLMGFWFETALPSEYLVILGGRLRPMRGGRAFRWFGLRKCIRIPASIQTLEFATDNANVHFQGLGIEGYAAWQINETEPERAIATLDMFDEEDPMAKTNRELNLMCVEAVRHVIANMTIEDAMRKKEEIALRLKEQLQQMESRWGIVFHHVGIRSVRVMSGHVFEDLQAGYRNEMRLQSSRSRIETDRQIAQQENALRETTETERIATDQRLRLAEVENTSRARAAALEQEEKLALSEDSLESRRISLETKRKRELQVPLLELEGRLAELEQVGSAIRLEMERARRAVEQTHGEAALAHELIARLPEIAAATRIGSYTVLDGTGASPLTRLVTELATLLRTDAVRELLGRPPAAEP